MSQDLKALRELVDQVDRKILRSLNERAKRSLDIGHLKRGKKQSFYQPDREKEVLRGLLKANRGPLSADALCAIYREIMSSSLSLEKDLNIAYLGPELTFTHQAGVKKFGQSVDYEPCDSIADVFGEVEHGRCDYGVVPVENSTEGAIYHTLDSFIETDLKICSEIILKIDLSLITKERSLSRVRKVYSNPQVFGQCRQWLESNLKKAELKSVSSTVRGAEIASRQKRAACIASPLAAERGGLRVLASSIQDRSDNVTRFLVISQESALPTKRDRTSIMLSVKDKVGALYGILAPFRRHRINLTKIESRPSRRRNWEYYFFIDFEGHSQERRVRTVLRKLEAECRFVKVLGSYPKSDA